ncbi:MAG: hypothetical protein Q4G48_08545 [Bacteroidia bacterium]|nr:hypothetical protein [Bacteroidia bacterium]
MFLTFCQENGLHARGISFFGVEKEVQTVETGHFVNFSRVLPRYRRLMPQLREFCPAPPPVCPAPPQNLPIRIRFHNF